MNLARLKVSLNKLEQLKKESDRFQKPNIVNIDEFNQWQWNTYTTITNSGSEDLDWAKILSCFSDFIRLEKIPMNHLSDELSDRWEHYSDKELSEALQKELKFNLETIDEVINTLTKEMYYYPGHDSIWLRFINHPVVQAIAFLISPLAAISGLIISIINLMNSK